MDNSIEKCNFAVGELIEEIEYMRKIKSLFVLVSILVLTAACSNSDNDSDSDVARLKGKIVSYNEFDGAMLDITEADMTKAGFSLGDVISLTIDERTFIMPYYDGYYTHHGELLCVAYPTYPSICFTANNTGLPEELRGLEGHDVTISMVEKYGCLDVQNAMNVTYSNERDDYSDLTDAEFANARTVEAGNIVSGILHRSTTPFTNDINRAYYVATYLEKEKVKSVLNLADTEEKMLSYDMPAYSRQLWESGNVILCPLKADPTADEFVNTLVAGLKELPSHPAPYLVHCMEGKDRTGYVCALLEGLCGATYEEIVADYLVTYYNFYLMTPEDAPDVCNTLVTLRLNPCLMFYAGISDETLLPDIDFAQAFTNFLLTHGMSQDQINALISALTTNHFLQRR